MTQVGGGRSARRRPVVGFAAVERPQPARRRLQARTARAQGLFLREFTVCGNVLRSARKAKVGRQTVYHWLKDDNFKALYDEAHENALDLLEEEARRRAVDGVDEPVVSGGKVVATVRRYSDALLITLLKAKRPETFRERHEVTGKDGGLVVDVKVLEKMSPAELIAFTERQLAIVRKAMPAAQLAPATGPDAS